MIWNKLSYFIINNRKSLLFIFVVITLLFFWKAREIKIAFNPGKILPSTDSTYIKYQNFRQKFGDDGNVMVLGVQNNNLFHQQFYQNWQKLHIKIEQTKGVKQVLSISNFVSLQKDTINKRFNLIKPDTKIALIPIYLDSIAKTLYKLPFYKNILFNDNKTATIMAITLDSNVLKSAKKIALIKAIEKNVNNFEKAQNTEVHISGLAYIKTVLSELVAKEFALFLALTILISGCFLAIFFKSFSSVFYPIILVICGVIWSVAFMVIFDFNITLLTGVIAPLMVIIGIPNSILIINKYQFEYQIHQNKKTALLLTIEKIGATIFIANLTTAIGFAVLYFTNSNVLQEFGITAAIGVMFTWLICLIILPIIFSFLAPPVIKEHQPLVEKKWITLFLEWVEKLVIYKLKAIYVTTLLLIIIAVLGVYQIKTNGFVVDDLPKSNAVYQDLKFFEDKFNGVLPLELEISNRKKNNIIKLSTLNKIDDLERLLKEYPAFGKAISLNNAVKYATQTFYNGNPNYYRTPNQFEGSFILEYVSNSGKGTNMTKSFVDSAKSSTRFTIQMKDIGSENVNNLIAKLKPRVDSVFNPKIYDVILTGPVIMYVEGTNYLVKNLKQSLILAIFLISLVMWFLFRSIKMVLISLIPNLIPLLITAGVMGFIGLALKPSTVLIFSIALGIASDQTIYFLTRYQQELKAGNFNILTIIKNTIKETGFSMIYTSIILFFGFGVFMFSTFGGTVALGGLLAITLLTSMLFNLIFLPALLISVYLKKDIEPVKI
ncbi:efflux RND transporter permease subunit [Pedobacter alpinus]|uniref:RND family transporter n=1 Tax=Pedobacter alpinus TaxID=1590643 RepID=A0ABW5TLV3_9SPHI